MMSIEAAVIAADGHGAAERRGASLLCESDPHADRSAPSGDRAPAAGPRLGDRARVGALASAAFRLSPPLPRAFEERRAESRPVGGQTTSAASPPAQAADFARSLDVTGWDGSDRLALRQEDNLGRRVWRIDAPFHRATPDGRAGPRRR